MTKTVSETLDVIARRYSCRTYTDQPVPHETLRAIAEAAAHAPSAVNRQPWRIVVVDDKAVVDDVSRLGLEQLRQRDEAGYNRILGRGGILLYDAPAMIVIAAQAQPGMLSADLDVGIVASHVVLAAASLGVDSCICGMVKLAFDGVGGEELKTRLGFPEGFEFGLSVLLGYGAGDGSPHVPDFGKIIEP